MLKPNQGHENTVRLCTARLCARVPLVVAERGGRVVEVGLEENAVALALQRLTLQVLRQHVIDVDAHGATKLQRAQLLAVVFL